MKIYIIIIISLLSYLHANTQCFPDRHSTNWHDGWVSCELQSNPNRTHPKSHWIQYDLGAMYKIDAMKIWNSNDPAHLDFGSKEILVDYSEDSIIWKEAGTITIDKADGTNRYEGSDWLSIDIPKARYILLTVSENFGGRCAGFAEIRFSAEKIKINVANESVADLQLELKAEPNPFSKECRVLIQSNEPGNTEYYISDMYGRILYQATFKMNRHFYYLDFDTQDWKPGMYVLSCKKGKQLSHLNLVKI